MQVTEVNFHLAQIPNSRLIAYVSIVIDHVLAVHDIRVINGHSGIFISMPDREARYPCHACKKKNLRYAKFCMNCGAQLLPLPANVRNFQNIIHPICQELRTHIETTILDKLGLKKTKPAEVVPQQSAMCPDSHHVPQPES